MKALAQDWTTPNNQTFQQHITILFNGEKADFMIFSDILNYGDTPKILQHTASLLSPGGKILIANKPHRGIQHFLSPQRVATNSHLLQIVKDCGYNIQEKFLVL
jgi:hypothetical protein